MRMASINKCPAAAARFVRGTSRIRRQRARPSAALLIEMRANKGIGRRIAMRTPTVARETGLTGVNYFFRSWSLIVAEHWPRFLEDSNERHNPTYRCPADSTAFHVGMAIGLLYCVFSPGFNFGNGDFWVMSSILIHPDLVANITKQLPDGCKEASATYRLGDLRCGRFL
jgi:hypothetical protein